jgi:hypothetical protein
MEKVSKCTSGGPALPFHIGTDETGTTGFRTERDAGRGGINRVAAERAPDAEYRTGAIFATAWYG